MNQISGTAPSRAISPDICAIRSGPPSSSVVRLPMIISPSAASVPPTRRKVSVAPSISAISGLVRWNSTPERLTPISPIRCTCPNRSVISVWRGVTVTSSVSPVRSIVNVSGTPGLSRTTSWSSSKLASGAPPTAVIRSPGSRPAASAALPG